MREIIYIGLMIRISCIFQYRCTVVFRDHIIHVDLIFCSKESLLIILYRIKFQNLICFVSKCILNRSCILIQCKSILFLAFCWFWHTKGSEQRRIACYTTPDHIYIVVIAAFKSFCLTLGNKFAINNGTAWVISIHCKFLNFLRTHISQVFQCEIPKFFRCGCFCFFNSCRLTINGIQTHADCFLEKPFCCRRSDQGLAV